MSVYREAPKATRWSVTIMATGTGPILITPVEITQVVDADSEENATRDVVDGHTANGWTVLRVVSCRPAGPNESVAEDK